MRNAVLLVMIALLGTASVAHAQPAATAASLYDIAYNGLPVTVDGELDDWDDAMWLFLSQDKLNFLDPDGNPIFGVPESPADFSAYFAMKMDDENVYFAARVRDEGVPLYDVPDGANVAWNYDHLTAYLGLYDIGDLPGSPHRENSSNDFQMRNPVADTLFSWEGSLTYRIAPGLDNSGTTLGPDYQIWVRALPYDGPVSGDDVQTYGGQFIDGPIPNTTAATQLFEDETGYILEWSVPFESLAGPISNREQFADFEWPRFQPRHNVVIPFDADVTDRDEADGGNVFMRLGNKPALFRDSYNFDFRGRIVDLNLHPNDVPATKYYVDFQDDQGVTIDGDLSDWDDAGWIGLSQDKQNFLDPNGNPIQGVPESPADFSGYVAMKMDDQNVYVAAIVRDEGTPLIGTPDSPNLAFNYDHLTLYLGLYDIGNAPSSPHVEGPAGEAGNFEFYDPVTGDTLEAGRSYRIAPDVDNTTTTLGADYQLLFRSADFGVVSGEDARQFNYSGGLVDTTIANTTGAAQLFEDETGYVVEWQIPLASLAGDISKPSREYSNFTWPLYDPAEGDVIVFDADLTDRDEGDTRPNRFLRVGNLPSLWRDSRSFGMRGQLVTAGVPEGVFVEDVGGEIPQTFLLGQNYPNPFNPTTTIPFALPQSAAVTLTVYNLLGQQVAVLVDGVLPAGRKEVSFDASGLPSGVYLVRLVTPGTVELRQMTLVK